MSESSRMSGEAFAFERLRIDPQLTFEALRQAAEQAGITIQPIQYGRARRQLGLTGSPPTAQSVSQEASSKPPIEATATESPAPVMPAPAMAPPELALPESAPPESAAPESAAPTSSGDAPGNPAGIAPTPAAAPKRKGSPAFDFLVESLRAEPALSYGELQTRSTAKGYKIAPIMYGRAKALLGLVPVAPRGQGKNRKSKLTSQQTLKQADAASADQFSQQLSRVRNVDDLVQIIKHLDGERRRLRGLLENIANSIDEALDHSDSAAS